MTALEYAVKHGMSRSKVVAACAEGRLPAVKHGGRTGHWEIIGDPPWPRSRRFAEVSSVTRAERERAARAVQLLAKHWRRGMELQMTALRAAYQGLDVSTDILYGHIHERPREAWL